MTYKIAKNHPITKDRQAIERHADRVEWAKSFVRAAHWYATRNNKPFDANLVKAIEHGQFYNLTIDRNKDGFKFESLNRYYHITAPWSRA